jgi:hypothetical protein
MRLSELRKKLPHEHEYQTVWSWCVIGKKHPYTRQMVRMEAVQTTVGIASSVDAYYRFLERLNEGV